ALLVMNRGICRQHELKQRRREFLRRLVVARPHINKMQLLAKPVADALGFRQHLAEARRESAGDSNCTIRWLAHLGEAIVGGLGALGNSRRKSSAIPRWTLDAGR